MIPIVVVLAVLGLAFLASRRKKRQAQNLYGPLSPDLEQPTNNRKFAEHNNKRTREFSVFETGNTSSPSAVPVVYDAEIETSVVHFRDTTNRKTHEFTVKAVYEDKLPKH